ncbi:MAG: cytochrome b6-f complex iron-sulfur subunit [Planktothrix sp. GU0601_MAG3]|nr:MAG: cytochrome b6-f complex iron-sulfur subunit [Planktothrix sp. GU0601_MAG3]
MTQISVTSDAPSMGRRQFMNLLTFGTVTGVAVGALYPVIKFFLPPSSGAAGGGVTAKDALGNDVIVSEFLSSHKPGDRVLAQGLKGDPTYMVIESDSTLAEYGINAVCTHLGCVVPWNASENKFMCPCHGSQYNAEGKVVRGPAPLSLPLVHATVADDKLSFTTWAETDFRTGENPWWS